MGVENSSVVTVSDKAALAERGADLVLQLAAQSIAERGRFVVALAGGNTPRPLYERLAEDTSLAWHLWHIFLSDERSVPPDHADSNYRMVRLALLDRLSPPPPMVYRWQTEFPPERAASLYDADIRRAFAHTEPRFDLIILGMGADGHTASLFPHTEALGETALFASANPVPRLGSTRLTFTFPLINWARNVLVLVSGADKNPALRAALSPAADPALDELYPIRKVAPADGTLTLLVDEAAHTGL